LVTIGSGIIDAPAAVSSGPDRIDVFALGANGQLLHKRFGPVRTSWSFAQRVRQADSLLRRASVMSLGDLIFAW